MVVKAAARATNLLTHHRRTTITAVVVVAVLIVAGLVLFGPTRDDDVAQAPSTDPPSTESPPTDSPPTSTVTASTTTSTEVPAADRLGCTDDNLGEILEVMRSGPIPLDVDRVPVLEALVTLGDRTVVGNVTSMVRERGQFSEWTTLDVDVIETLAGPPIEETVDRISFMSSGTFFADPDGEADPIASPVAVTGVRFIAVLERFPDAPGGWAVFIQGLSIACEDNDPLTGVLAPFPQTTTASITDLADDVRAMNRVVASTSETVTRPIVARDICAPPAVPAPPIEGDTDDAPVTFFAKPSEFPVPIQIFADPDLGPAGPIVMVMRFRDRPDDSVNGAEPYGPRNSRVRIFDNGVGEAIWTADDGSTGYLRSRGVDEVAGLGKLIAFATHRDLDAQIPGFDYFTDDDRTSHYNVTGQLQLLHEAMNTELAGSFAGSECMVESTGFVYRISRLSGDPVLQFGAVLDRPPPIEVGLSGDSVIIINGNADVAAPTVADIRDATDDEWDELFGGG